MSQVHDQSSVQNVNIVANGTTTFQWYDPATGRWSQPLQTSLYGTLIAVTSTDNAENVAMWLAEYSNDKQGLSRYIL